MSIESDPEEEQQQYDDYYDNETPSLLRYQQHHYLNHNCRHSREQQQCCSTFNEDVNTNDAEFLRSVIQDALSIVEDIMIIDMDENKNEDKMIHDRKEQ